MIITNILNNQQRRPCESPIAESINQTNLSFGPEYIIPKPLDPRLLSTVAPAVAKAAVASGVAQLQITN